MNITLYHGSQNIITSPSLPAGKETNDYGKGFYCTQDLQLAREWACKKNTDGWANQYTLDTTGLSILDLQSAQYNILHWITILLEHRTFVFSSDISSRSADFLTRHFHLPLENYDIVTGWRADDSYFSYAQSFLSNSLSLQNLSQAMKLGNLGTQTVLVSQKAFNQLKFQVKTFAPREIYYPKFFMRDTKARRDFKKLTESQEIMTSHIYMIDILRKGEAALELL